jgi:hypothetical protein
MVDVDKDDRLATFLEQMGKKLGPGDGHRVDFEFLRDSGAKLGILVTRRDIKDFRVHDFNDSIKQMLKLSVKKDGKNTVVDLEGQIDETFSLEQELPDPEGPLDLYCAKINRINSIGVKKWILYLQGIMKKTEIRFFELSPAVVEQFNLISNFGANGTVMSLALPYECKSCQNLFCVVKLRSELVQTQGKLSTEKCPKCGNLTAEFDDIPEEYLHFLHLG